MKSYSDLFTDFEAISKKEELSFINIKDAIVLPCKVTLNGPKWGVGGVLNNNYEYVEESGFASEWISFGGKYDIAGKKINYISEEVIWFGFFEEHWGHFLIDFISRMWYILKDYKNQKIIYISRYSEMESNFKEFMNYLGVADDRLLKINEITQFDNVIIPEYAFTEKFYSPQYIDIFDHVIKNSNYQSSNIIEKNKKIYFSRSNFFISKQKEFGEPILQNIFHDNGFQTISPEQLSLKDQIFIWNNASEIACINGTIPLNIAFCRKNDLKLIVFNKAPLHHQNLLTYIHIFKHSMFFLIDAYYKKFGKQAKSLGNGPFFLFNSQELQKFCRDEGLINNGKSGQFYYLKSYFFLFQNRYFNFYKYIDKLQKVKRMFLEKKTDKP